MFKRWILKRNIALVCLNDFLRKETAKSYAKANRMLYLDIDELIDFEVISRKQVSLKCGDEFLKKLEKECITQVVDYENCVFSLSADLFLANDNKVLLEDCTIVYLATEMHAIDISKIKNKSEKTKLQQSMDINNNINDFLQKICPYVVENADIKSIVEIIDEIKSFGKKSK